MTSSLTRGNSSAPSLLLLFVFLVVDVEEVEIICLTPVEVMELYMAENARSAVDITDGGRTNLAVCLILFAAMFVSCWRGLFS